MSATPDSSAARQATLWLVLLAAAGIFALTMGARQSMGLFLGTINTSTGLGLVQHQPRVRLRPVVVGTDPALRRHGGRPHRRRARAGHRHLSGRDRHGADPLHDEHRRPYPRDRRSVSGRRRHGRAGRAHGGDLASGRARQTRPRNRHRQCRRVVRPVRLRATRPGHHGRRGMGHVDPEPGGLDAAGVAGCVGCCAATRRRRRPERWRAVRRP